MFLSVEDVEILPLLSTGPCRFGLVESEMSELEVVFTLEKVKLCFSFGSEALSMPSFLVAEEAPIFVVALACHILGGGVGSLPALRRTSVSL